MNYSTKISVKGFSLIEVLVASFITFISLSIFTLVFRGSLLSSQKAESSVESSAVTSLIVSKVSSEIRGSHNKNSLSGKGKLLGHDYHWQAEVIDIAKPPARIIGSEMAQADHILKMWRISVTQTLETNSHSFYFDELSW